MLDPQSPTKPNSTWSEDDYRISSVGSSQPNLLRKSVDHSEKGESEEIHGISVQRAEAEFQALDNELKQTLSKSRSNTYSIKKIASRKETNPTDLEKGVRSATLNSSGSDDDEPFDLESTLRGDRVAAEAEGIKSKEVGVLWKNLSVRGLGGSRMYVQTFPDMLLSWVNPIAYVNWLIPCLKTSNRSKQVSILQDFRGVVKPGEMVLVLGRPGSGCTTFLKVIANQRFGYTGVDGEVNYGTFDAQTFQKRYRGEAVYNAEDESGTMLPTLTVKQTLDFALDCKVPGKRPAGLSRKEFKDKVVNMLLRMFNIEVSGRIDG
jgi:ATP-binding cassette subfamily G (WHITE) protein 2 (SNQ2)